MSSIEQLAFAWHTHGWSLLLAFTAATLLVLLLRRPYRRIFGAERGFQLWVLVPLALLSCLLPHAQAVKFIVLPPSMQNMASAGVPNVDAVDSTTIRDISLLLAWLSGVAVTLVRAVFAQRRYRMRMRGAMSLAYPLTRWPVLRAAAADVGPAMVGAWRPCIVLPADFDERYTATERELILMHESMHARRCDGWWRLCAQVVVAVFWFHPFAWLGWSAFTDDQELACDADVIAACRASRRSYANAMLKTRAATTPLPVGCSWSPRHPITERIAMLKLRTPSRRRKKFGLMTLSVGMIGLSGFVYAATQSPAAVTSVSKASDSYQLALVITRGGETLAHPTICTDGSEPMSIYSGNGDENALKLTFAVKQAGNDQVQVSVGGTVSQSGHNVAVSPVLRGPLGQTMSVRVGDAAGKSAPIELAMTPTAGCGARQATVSDAVKNGHVRDAAQTVAAKAGYVLVNPDALDERPVSFDFQQIPPERALQLLATIDGKQAMFQGMQVRFESSSNH